MKTPREKLLQVLALGLICFVAGCSKRYDAATLEKEVLDRCNENLIAKGDTGKCTNIKLVADGENKFVGFVDFGDGSQKSLTVTVDPKTGDWVTSDRAAS